jgi:DNA-binding PadR family transcriptional regulator
MSLKHGLLGLLNYGSMTGYELNTSFKYSLSFFWKVQTSQIYRELDAMERMEWLVSERVIQEDKPNRRVYTITSNGKEELQRWLTSSPSGDIEEAMRVRSAFLMRLFFAGERPSEEALCMLQEFQEQCKAAISRLESSAKKIDGYREEMNDTNRVQYWELVNVFGSSYLQAQLEWATKSIALLTNKK